MLLARHMDWCLFLVGVYIHTCMYVSVCIDVHILSNYTNVSYYMCVYVNVSRFQAAAKVCPQPIPERRAWSQL